MTPEQQLHALQIKAQHLRDLPAWGPWHLAGMVVAFIMANSK